MTSGEQSVWLITGASRGIGLEMTRQLLQSPTNTVVAACRTPSKAVALKELGKEAKGTLHVVKIDIDNPESIRACADETTQALGNKGIDYIVNNAAVVIRDDSAFEGDVDTLLRTFKTNVAGSAHVSHAFLPLLEKGRKKTIVNISSTAGSIGANWSSIQTSYSISKTALNMLTYKQAKSRPDITAISLCPGWLETDMGGPNAMHPVSVGVEGIFKVVASLTPEKSGQFFNFKGEHVPW
ncbi:NAD(P)-binding protein [Earliella scabrosa]|nr:NAD(P)-binding protein [Earliella scabrosa]